MDKLPLHLRGDLLTAKERHDRLVRYGERIRRENSVPIAGLESAEVAGIIAVATTQTLDGLEYTIPNFDEPTD